jgi:hypothetical protein
MNLSCLGVVAWRLRSDLTPTLLLFLLITPAMLAQCGFGQIAGVLALAVDSAWRANRDRRATAAGLWLGTAVAMKPFLLPVMAWWLVRRQWRSLACAWGTVLALFGLGAILFGAQAYIDWAMTIAQVDWYHLSANASLLGAVQRSGLDMAVQSPTWLAACAGVGLATGLATWRTRDVDRAWAALLVASLLLSPLGWTYYELILIGPLLLAVRSSEWVAGACLLAWIPPDMIPGQWSIATFALLMIWGTLLWNVGYAASARRGFSPSQTPGERGVAT